MKWEKDELINLIALIISISVFLYHPSSDHFSTGDPHPPAHSPQQGHHANQVERLRPNPHALVKIKIKFGLFAA
jgi:hypothetical protein